MIFVAVRYTQIETILETLRASRAKTIIFVGNNVCASETAAYLPEKNVLFAFTSAAGHRESNYVDSVDLRKITVGPLRGAAYRKTCFRFFKLMCATVLGKICASDHAMNAVDEMRALNRDIKTFFDAVDAEYQVWQALEAECGRYLL